MTQLDSVSENIARTYSLVEAEKHFGPPVSKDEFIVDGALPEFRISLYRYYSKNQYLHDTILVKEYTWKKDEANNITIWYVQDGNTWKCIDLFSWPKDAIF